MHGDYRDLRMRELLSLLEIGRVVEERDRDLADICRRIARVIPRSWPDSRDVSIRVTIENCTYGSPVPSWEPPAEKIPILARGRTVGVIELFPAPGMQERCNQAFRDGKALFLRIVAHRLGQTFERIKAERDLRDRNEQYHSLMETLRDVVYVIDLQGRFSYLNSALTELTGFAVEEFLGRPFTDLIAGPYVADTLDRFNRGIAGEESPIYEAEFLARTDEPVPVELHVTTLRDADRTPLGRLGIARDVRERKKAHRALMESELLMRSLFNSLQAGVVVMRPDRAILRVNEGLIRMFGYSEEELIGQTPGKLHVGSDRYNEFLSTRLAGEVFEKGRTVTFEYEMKRKNGEIFPTEHTLSPLRNDAGEEMGILSVVRDITERKRAEQALKKAYDGMETKVEERTAELMETNTALRVLLKTRERDKQQLEDNIVSNVKKIIFPQIHQMKRQTNASKTLAVLDMLESNLEEIVKPFSQKLSSEYFGLTGKEIQIANFVKEGKNNREIAEMMHVTQRTVGFHRENIRRKLGLKNRKTNLRSHLLVCTS